MTWLVGWIIMDTILKSIGSKQFWFQGVQLVYHLLILNQLLALLHSTTVNMSLPPNSISEVYYFYCNFMKEENLSLKIIMETFVRGRNLLCGDIHMQELYVTVVWRCCHKPWDFSQAVLIIHQNSIQFSWSIGNSSYHAPISFFNQSCYYLQFLRCQGFDLMFKLPQREIKQNNCLQ